MAAASRESRTSDEGSPSAEPGRSARLPADLRHALGLISGNVTDAAASLRFVAALVRELGPLWDGVAELQEALTGLPPAPVGPDEGGASHRLVPPPELAAPAAERAGAVREAPEEPEPLSPPARDASSAPAATTRPPPAPEPAGEPSLLALTLRWPTGSVNLPRVHQALDRLPSVNRLVLAACSSHSAHIEISARRVLRAEEVEQVLAHTFPGGLRREGSMSDGLVMVFEEDSPEEAP